MMSIAIDSTARQDSLYSDHHVGERRHAVYTFLLCIICSMPLQATATADGGNSADITNLKQRVDILEQRLQQLQGDTLDKKEHATEASNGLQPSQPPVKFGGALRFNYFLKDYDASLKKRRGDIGFDLFRVNADGNFGKLYLSAEYRFYTYMNTIHHGYVGYHINDRNDIEGGITQVPFGLLPYAAHNFWFGIPYYLGLSDDYDSGVKFHHHDHGWDWQLAFYKNAELGNAADLNRYSYDPVTTGAAANQESNTVNARAAYTFGKNSACANELGISGMTGRLFNTDTRANGDRWAAASHLDSHCGRWNVQLEMARYGYNPRNPAGVSDRTVMLGAFGATHDIAARGTVYVTNLAYNVPVPWEGVKLLTCYNDYSMLDKDFGFDTSYINTTGCLINIGPTYIYVDLIRGRNMVYLGNGSLADGGSGTWRTRFNVNFGIYW